MRTKAIRGWGLLLALVGIVTAGLFALADEAPPPPADLVNLWIQVDGVGDVTRDPEGIEWLGSFRYPVGTVVTLTAHPGAGYWCTGWTVETGGVEEQFPIADPGPGEPCLLYTSPSPRD